MYTYYRNRIMNTQTSQNTAAPTEYDQNDVWAAAVYAYNINQAYLKEPVYADATNMDGTQVKIKDSNRNIADNVLKDLSVLDQTHRDQGQAVRKYLIGKFTFAALSSKLNDFERVVLHASSLEKFTATHKLEYSVIVSVIASYHRYVIEDQINERVEPTAPSLGVVGEKIEVDIEVLKNVFSNKYGVNFITGVTDLGQKVFFSFRDSAKIGKRLHVKATIKAFRPDATQLNRAKIIDHK